jgi:pyridoxine 5-phosphate synthase
VGAAELTESLGPQAIHDIPVGHYVPLLEFNQLTLVKSAVATAKQLGCRVILFVDPDPDVIPSVPETGADGIEIFTGAYAAAERAGEYEASLNACAETARRAADLSLAVNIGHDLNLQNLPPLVAAMPAVAEASIGHELTELRGFGRFVTVSH